MPNSFKNNSVTAIIAAAGLGTRLGRDIEKQFLGVSGKPIMALTIETIQSHPAIKEIIVAVPPGREDFVQEAIIDRYKLKVTCLVKGGENRQESVGNCMKEVGNTDYVLVHDGVRPFVTHEIIDGLLAKVDEVGAVISATPVTNTTKKIEGNRILETIDRNQLISVQTPQLFKRELLLNALNKAKKDNFVGTDEASLLEYAGYPVNYVIGSSLNIKITTEEDLVFAGAIFHHLNASQK